MHAFRKTVMEALQAEGNLQDIVFRADTCFIRLVRGGFGMVLGVMLISKSMKIVLIFSLLFQWMLGAILDEKR